MSEQYAYYYAIIDLETGMCVGVEDTTYEVDLSTTPEYIAIPEYSDDYLLRYYNQANGQWYEDADFTIPYTPPV